MADEYSVESLLLLARQHQSNPALLDKPITARQLTALHARLYATGIPMTRSERLEILREILGYNDLVKTSKDLTMADGFGLLGLEEQDFSALVMWADVKLEKEVRI